MSDSEVRNRLYLATYGSGLSPAERTKLIDDLLHEEAEKVRNSPGWCEGEWMDSRDREYAADLIDPYVK